MEKKYRIESYKKRYDFRKYNIYFFVWFIVKWIIPLFIKQSPDFLKELSHLLLPSQFSAIILTPNHNPKFK